MDLIVAIDQNRGIGKDGGMLVHLPGDLRYFREKTLHKTVVMGYKTLLSLPHSAPLRDRRNLVLTRRNITVEGAQILHSVDALLDEIRAYPEEEVFVIGGGSVYQELLPFCRRALVTEIDASFEADTFFPALDGFSLVSRSAPQTENGIRYSFCVYERSDTATQK